MVIRDRNMDERRQNKDAFAVFAKKRVPPHEMKARLTAVKGRLSRDEEEARQRAHKAEEATKASLRLGDERGFQREAKRYSLASRQGEMVRGMLMVVGGMLDVVEAQLQSKQTVADGEKIAKWQREIGMDAHVLDAAMANVRHGADYVNQASLGLTQAMKVTALEEAGFDELELIRGRFLAQINSEASMGKRVKQDVRQESRQTVAGKSR